MKTLLNKKTAAALALCLSMSVSTFGQSQVIHLTENKATVSSIIKAIEKQTQMSVDFSQNTINLNKTVSLKSKTMTLGELMNQILAGDNNLTYKIVDRHIVVVKSAGNKHQLQKAQNRGGKHKLTGVVLDQNGEPIIGASVLEKGTKNGTVTDIDGNFELSVSAETPVVEVSYIGFDVQTLKMNSGQATTIRMRENSHNLNEVVVVGYGTQKKANLTGAVTSMKNDDLLKAKAANSTNALIGRMPGIIAKQASGEPGADYSSIYIRGIATFRGDTQPAYIIDGVERSSGDFARMDPNDIESINVLKDAASAAIFGMRGANGVIVITTKRGAQAKPTIKYSGNLSHISHKTS